MPIRAVPDALWPGAARSWGERRCEVTTISHEPSRVVQRPWAQVLVPETWASLAIVVIWLSVLFATIWGGDIVSTTTGGTNSTVPTAVVLAPFAFAATWVIARYGFRGRKTDD
jgi:hypothetical protein